MDNLASIPLRLYSTDKKKIVPFKPQDKSLVRMYSCGPTVYDYTHIGHARTYVLTDILKRVLYLWGYKIKHVMNITDVGHLTSDDDLGQDKLLKAYYREKKKGKKLTIWDIINYYTNDFLTILKKLNIVMPDVMPRATEHVPDMIKAVQKLLEKGYAYKTSQAIYFHVPKFKEYTKLFPQALDEKIIGAREGVNVDTEKKHPADFRLWQLDQPNHLLLWDTPWGKGFPGWHIECSVMSTKHLGDTLDIHTGGEDHIFPHHTNEIAQSEALTCKPFSRYWIHFYHLMVNGKKMSKSLGNYYRLVDLEEKGFKPEHLRMLFLNTHYRKRMNFTLEALDSAKEAYNTLIEHYQVLRSLRVLDIIDVLVAGKLDKTDFEVDMSRILQDPLLGLFTNKAVVPPTISNFLSAARALKVEKIFSDIFEQFLEKISNDLNIPQAVSVLWKGIKNHSLDYKVRLLLVAIFNRVFGVKLVPFYTAFELVLQNEHGNKQLLEVLNTVFTIKKAKINKNFKEADLQKAQLVKKLKEYLDTNSVKIVDIIKPTKISVPVIVDE